MKNSNRLIVGACGEYYVAAYLSGFDFVVALPRGGTATVDLFVTKEKGVTLSVQVKTGKEAKRGGKYHYVWRMARAPAIERQHQQLWYAFVWLNGWPEQVGNLPKIFFVPSKVVAKCLKETDEEDKFPSFWMGAADAEQYEGRNGLDLLEDAVRGK